MSTIITKEEAKGQKLKRYFTGVPCKKHGHISERLVRTGECISCKQIRENRNFKNTNGKAHKEWYKRNRQMLIQKQQERDSKRINEIRLYQKKWRDLNKEHIKQYMKQNSGLYAFHAARRRKKIARATPAWAERDAICDLYLKAASLTKETGIKHEVDHIIPIINKTVCGLNCIDNLRIITEKENRAKKNKIIERL